MAEEIQEPIDEQPNPSLVDESDGAQAFLSAPDEADHSAVVVSDAADSAGNHSALKFPIVGIGGSAGGLEAYIEIFRHLSHSTGMAFVLVPHLSADKRSYLPEIVARHTRMQTASIEEGVRPQPDHVYLLPPNATLFLRQGVFHLETRAGDGQFHPIDAFFKSLAAEQKNLAIGIVLSGMDADGSLGLRAINSEGGISIVQAPESARFPDMPRCSISADHVHMVLPPDQIGIQLAEVAQKLRSPKWRELEEGLAPERQEKHLARILKQLKGVSGIDFRLYKSTTVRRRIARRMLMHRIDSLAEYAGILQADPREVRDLQEDILISVTQFFRDPEVFDALKMVVFPQTFEDGIPDRQVRIWVPGCSSGEEVYSIAICLLEYLGVNAIQVVIQIFGSDASEPSIRKARMGLYPETIKNEVSPERLRRFFLRTEGGYQITKRIRDMCIFARQNLCSDPPFSRLDLISCRNVLIYFGSQLQNQVISTFHYGLRPDGFLLLGNAETIRNFSDLFSLVDRKHRIYSKVGDTRTRALLHATPNIALRDFTTDDTKLFSTETWSDLDLQRAADRIVLARYSPPGVVVNEQLEIVQSRGHTGPFLELAQGSASLNLGRMVRGSSASEIVAAVKRAIDQGVPVQVEGLRIEDNGQTRETTLEVLPMQSSDSRSKRFLVLFVPSQAANGGAVSKIEPLPAEMKEADRERLVAQLHQDLSSTKIYLQSLLEEREAKTQELISANEEIQSANEELQSANEELETTKEELQSSNEELQTVNDELQNRNAVLTQASNDLQNLLNSVNLPVLMLSSDFSIRHFTSQTQRLMNVRASDVGRPFGDIRLNLNIDHLEPLFTEVLDTLATREVEVQDRDGHWYLLRVRPYRTTENKIDGVVMVLLDIDQLRRSQQQLRDASDFARAIIESIPLPLVVVDSDFRIRSTNEAFCTLAASTSHSLDRRSLPDLAAVQWGMDEPLRSLLEGLRGNNDSGTRFEFEHKSADDSPRTFLIRGRVLQPAGEQFLLLTFEDITAHKEVERLLKSEGERLAGEVESTNKELERSREDLRGLTGSLMTTQEEEARRLARELHDDISQRLAAANMLGEEAVGSIAADPQLARQKLQQTLEQIGQLADDVRTISHGLHPSMLEHLGLATALRALSEEFGEREQMISSFSASDVPEQLDQEIATGLYRIAQEALRNVAKHAGKTHVKVTLTGMPAAIELQVADAGRGFNTEKRSGLGLISIRERARLIGATVNIQSALGEGTKVTVNVPLAGAA